MQLKKLDYLMLERDLEALESAELAWKEIRCGRYRKLGKDDFLKELSAW